MTKLSTKFAAAGLALMLGTVSASASVAVTIERDGFGSGPIKVISEDGQKWTKIVDGDLTLPVKIYLGISSGSFVWYRVLQPMGAIYQSGEFLNGWGGDERSITYIGSTKHLGGIETMFIRNRCNEHLNTGAGINEKRTFWHAVELELVGYFEMTNGESYPPYSGYGSVLVPVECLPFATVTGDVADGNSDAHNSTPPKIKEARLFLTTFSGGKNKGVTFKGCPALETTVRFETDKAGPVSFDLHRFPGGMTSHTVNASFDASAGKYYARHQKQETFKSPTNLQYMAESTTPLGGNTGWEEITIHCGGGLADPGASDPGDVLPPVQLKGDFSFPADQSTSCPRKGKALIAFHTSVKNNVHYSLDCTNGHFSGVAQPVPKPGGGYVAPAVATFDIAITTQVNCVLKSVAPGAPKVHVLKGHKYQCVRTTGTSGSDDLVPDTRPDPKKPEKPGKFVADPPRTPDAPKADKGKTTEPKIVCAGGRVRGGACVCARTDKKVKVETNIFHCVKVVADPPRNKHGANETGAKLKGGKSDKGETKSKDKSAKRKGGQALRATASSRALIAR